MAGALQLNLLGTINVSIDEDQILDLSVRKEAALLAYLATEHTHAHTRDSLVGLLWPNSPTDKARLSLRVNLSNLKRRLAALGVHTLLRVTPFEVQLMADGCRLDTVEFSRCLRSGERHEHGRDELCDRCAPEAARAVALYRGPFLEGFYLDQCQLFEEWLFMQRERFWVQMVDALEKLAAYYLRRGENEQVLAYARRLLELDPLRELAHQQIIQIHMAQGDRASALRQYERCRAVLQSELGITPSPELRSLHEQLLLAPLPRAAQPSLPADIGRTPSYLPIYLTPFVGRREELALLAQRMREGSRLFTLVGAGGMGKTRLAVEAAQQHSAQFVGGVYFVPCTAVKDHTAVADALAVALGITFRADSRSPRTQLLDWLRPRQVLLVVDNFEHLLPAASLLVEIVQAAPQVVILVTSREPLGVQAEDVVHISGLPVPGPTQMTEANDFPAVRLFVDRAYRMDKRFHLHAGNVADVVLICQLVAGQPLALELAAARTADRTCRAITEAIAADLDFLAAELPDLPVRHHSLRAIFEQNWQALVPAEQSCFSRLSVFHDPFSVEAADAVAGASVGMLTRLQKAHLIQRHEDYEHFSFHELLRRFAADKLASSLPDPTTLLRRHAEYFLTWLSRQEQLLAGIQPMRSAERIQNCLNDVRQAWQWAGMTHAVDLLQRALPVLAGFYAQRGLHQEGEACYRATLAYLDADDEGLTGQLLAHLGASMEKQGKIEEGRAALEKAIASALLRQDYQTMGNGYLSLARLRVSIGEISAAIDLLRNGLALLPKGEFLTLRAELLLYLGVLEGGKLHEGAAASVFDEARQLIAHTGNKAQEQRLLLYQAIENAGDNYLTARFYFEQALTLCPLVGDRSLEARTHNGLGFVLGCLGDYEQAIHHHQRGLALAVADQDALQQTYALHNLCYCYGELGDLRAAYGAGQEGLAIAERNHLHAGVAYVRLHLGHVLVRMRLYQEATRALLAAKEIFAHTGERALELEAEIGVAHACSLLGDFAGTLAHVAPLLEYLKAHSLTGCDDPPRAYLCCYLALRACGDNRAGAVLQAAYGFIQERAAPLDSEARARYLTAVPANRQIMEMWGNGAATVSSP